MKFYLLQKRFSARLHIALATLMLLLQRGPAIKLLLDAKQLQASPPVARILQSFALPAAALATPHDFSGASSSSYKVEYINTSDLKIGVEAVIKFENTITPRSWTIEGELPPGMRITDLRLRKSVVDGVIAADFGIITGSPTQDGTYNFVLTPWSNEDGTGETAPEPGPRSSSTQSHRAGGTRQPPHRPRDLPYPRRRLRFPELANIRSPGLSP